LQSDIEEHVAPFMDIGRLQSLLKLKSLNNESALLRIRTLPHKNGYPKILIKYEYSESLEHLLQCDFEKFFNMCCKEWNRLNADHGNDKKDLFPVMWRMFAPKSHRKIMWTIFEFYLAPNPKLEIIEEMNFWDYNGKMSKCDVFFKIERFPEPYSFIPYSFSVVIKPHHPPDI
jgi:hypothetical protein